MTTLWPTPDELDGATPHQREKYALATRGPVGVIGGNPGAGKTYLSGLIIKALAARYGISEVSLAAPTGKAAVRLTESVARHKVGLEATTIHRMLGVNRAGHDGKGWGFTYDSDNPLLKRFIFVDEASMLGTSLDKSLLAALLPGTHVLFVGDFAQLPPVDHGAPLRDMIAAGLPYGELTEILRNEGDIVRACRQLKSREPFTPSPSIDLAAGRNLKHIEAPSASASLKALTRLYSTVPREYDPVWDVQVVCATNDSGPVSRKPLNKLLQTILNPNGETVEGSRFRIGDKVICLSNGFMPLLQCPACSNESVEFNGKTYTCSSLACCEEFKPKDMIEEFVANGEIGRVVALDKKWLHVAFDLPRRTVRVAGESLLDFDLAYCCTCHKIQGSQAPVVIVMCEDTRGGDFATSWEWWRTAFSRAEVLCFTIGRKSAIDRQCRRSALGGRKTFLREQLESAA